MKVINKWLCLSLICATQATHGITPEAIVFVKGDHKIVCFPDWHIDFAEWPKAGKWQKYQVVQCAKQCNAFLIAEDMLKYNGQHKLAQDFTQKFSESNAMKDKAHQSLIIKTTQQLIGQQLAAAAEILRSPNFVNNLIRDCTALGIDCYGAECRHVAELSETAPALKIAAKDVAQEL